MSNIACSANLIWTLHEMLRLYAHFFTGLLVDLEALQIDLLKLPNWQEEVRKLVDALRKACAIHHFKQLEGQAGRIIERATNIPADVIDERRHEVKVLLSEFQRAVVYKLQSCLFVRISTTRVEFYSDDDLPLFGKEVQKKFGEATHDIAEAGRCYALERWDATVYHLMLATEHALRKWAKALKVKTKGRPIDLLDWKPIIDCAEEKLKQMRGMKKNTRRANNMERLAAQLAHFGFIKDAYRNVCSHGRSPFNEQKATSIMNHVKAFMQSLA